MEYSTVHIILFLLKISAGLTGTILLALEVQRAHFGEAFHFVKEKLNETDEKGAKPRLASFYTMYLLARFQARANTWQGQD